MKGMKGSKSGKGMSGGYKGCNHGSGSKASSSKPGGGGYKGADNKNG